MKKLIAYILILLAALFLITAVALAQPPPMFPDVPEQAPLDGGLLTITAVGALYAFKKISNLNQK